MQNHCRKSMDTYLFMNLYKQYLLHPTVTLVSAPFFLITSRSDLVPLDCKLLRLSLLCLTHHSKQNYCHCLPLILIGTAHSEMYFITGVGSGKWFVCLPMAPQMLVSWVPWAHFSLLVQLRSSQGLLLLFCSNSALGVCTEPFLVARMLSLTT